MATSAYLSGEYLSKDLSRTVEDPAWKAGPVFSLIERHFLHPRTVVEIGCGAGETLAQLQSLMPNTCSFTGYELSAQAFAMCCSRVNFRLRFNQDDGLAPGRPAADLALALDVVEYTEDYPAFLRSMRSRARHAIFHVPLDLSLLSLMTGQPQRLHRSAGQLHFFTRELVVQALQESGFEIIEARYTHPAIERPTGSWRERAARLARVCAAFLHEDLAALTLGGFSLLVLARARETTRN